MASWSDRILKIGTRSAAAAASAPKRSRHGQQDYRLHSAELRTGSPQRAVSAPLLRLPTAYSGSIVMIRISLLKIGCLRHDYWITDGLRFLGRLSAYGVDWRLHRQ